LTGLAKKVKPLYTLDSGFIMRHTVPFLGIPLAPLLGSGNENTNLIKACFFFAFTYSWLFFITHNSSLKSKKKIILQ